MRRSSEQFVGWAERTVAVGQAFQPDATPRGQFVRLESLTYASIVFLSLAATAVAQRPFGADTYRAPANQGQVAGMVAQIGIDQHLGETLPLDIELRDEEGKTVQLGQYFHEQPVVLMLVYYRCPMLCTQVANGFLKSSQAIKYAIGSDYQVVTVSFDPRETPELSAEKKASYVRAYRREGAADGWHFLTGDEKSIRRLTEAVGFRYRYDPKSDQYAHASGIVVATPDGQLSRYFYGIDYEPSHLRMALIESSQGRIGSPVEKVLLMCFHYDPMTGKYGLAIAAALRLGGIVTMLVLGGFLLAMYRQERRRSKTAWADAVGEVEKVLTSRPG